MCMDSAGSLVVDVRALNVAEAYGLSISSIPSAGKYSVGRLRSVYYVRRRFAHHTLRRPFKLDAHRVWEEDVAIETDAPHRVVGAARLIRGRPAWYIVEAVTLEDVEVLQISIGDQRNQ